MQFNLNSDIKLQKTWTADIGDALGFDAKFCVSRRACMLQYLQWYANEGGFVIQAWDKRSEADGGPGPIATTDCLAVNGFVNQWLSGDMTNSFNVTSTEPPFMRFDQGLWICVSTSVRQFIPVEGITTSAYAWGLLTDLS